MSAYAASLEDVQAAHRRIAPHIHETPVLTSRTLDGLAGRQLFFKAEIFQKGGSFKIRGATNAVLSLSERQAARGVVTHSSGNHGAAVALAARLRGVTAQVVVPSSTPQIKQRAIEGYLGAAPVVCEATINAREAACAAIQKATGAIFLPPYNDGRVIAGQGTIALEFLQQVPDLDAIVVPVSGGGMISGIAIAAKALRPGIKILAAEPVGRSGDAADVAAAKAAGGPVAMPKPQTICDGLEARLGSLTWPLVRDLVDGVITVSEEQVVQAMQLAMERMKVVVEPSGAAGIAAVLSPAWMEDPAYAGCQRVGVVLCGGNIDVEGRVPGFWQRWLEGE